MDTHDCHDISLTSPLKAGCVVTIEPGIYIPDWEEFGELRGVGIRIEDDVLVTHDGYEVSCFLLMTMLLLLFCISLVCV